MVKRRSFRGLRPRVVLIVSLVSALSAVTVALTSYLLVGNNRLQTTIDAAERQSRLNLDLGAGSVLRASLTDSELLALTTTMARSGGFEAVVFFAGRELGTSPRFTGAAVPIDLKRAVDAGRIARTATTIQGEPFLIVGGLLPRGVSLYFFYSLSSVFEELRKLRLVLASAAALPLSGSVVVGTFAARRVLSPIRRTAEAAAKLEAGALGTRLHEEGDDELSALARSFNAMAAALETKVGELSQLEASHRRFVSDVSHELRTPLTALTATAGILEEHLRELDAEGRRAAELLLGDVRRLARLVDELMEISRLDAGVAPTRPELVNLTEAVERLVEHRGWNTQVQVESSSGLLAWTDPRRLDAIVSNLVDNALTHGRPPVRVSVASREGKALIAVSDAGSGIGGEHLPLIFERFYKVGSESGSGPGSGLGLAIARKNARLLDGDLSVESGPEGSVFTLELPLLDPPKEVDTY